MEVKLMLKILPFILIFLLPTGAYGKEKEIEITYLGHSMFLIKSDTVSIVTDPFDPATGFPAADVSADIVTVSHTHSDHNYVSIVKGNPAVVRDTAEVKGIKFLGIPSYHDNKGGTLRGKNTIIKWSLDGVTFAHLGDFGEDELSEVQYELLKDVDIIFIPAGGFFTIDASKTYSIIRRLKPKMAILMHYRVGDYGLKQLASVEEIKGIIPELEKLPSTVKVSKGSLPENTKIVYMDIHGGR
jgi:L-ascorbate metabolism protein UlaG (beta-lactamase superfamily)